MWMHSFSVAQVRTFKAQQNLMGLLPTALFKVIPLCNGFRYFFYENTDSSDTLLQGSFI